MSYKSLIINPGSTSTKIGVFEDETLLFEETLRHSTEEIAQYDSIVAQKDFRKDVIAKVLAENNFDIKTLLCYFFTFWQKFIRIVATCWRAALPCGSR